MLYPNELRAQKSQCLSVTFCLKLKVQARRVNFEFGRGREIRTPDILLPKQARYQTALYPELNTPYQKGQGPRPRFQDAHDTHPPDKRQRYSDDFATVCAA